LTAGLLQTGDLEVTGRLAEGVWGLALSPDSPTGVAFRSGQHLYLSLDPERPETLWPVSIASSASRPRRLEFCLAESGLEFAVGPAFCEPRKVRFEGPSGPLWLDEGASGHLFVAAGAGIAPIRSMLLEWSERRGGSRAHLIYGHRRRAEAAYLDELAALAAVVPQLEVTVALTRESDPAPFQRGRVGECIARIAPFDPTWTAYVCGSPGMVEEAVGRLVALGHPRERCRRDGA